MLPVPMAMSEQLLRRTLLAVPIAAADTDVTWKGEGQEADVAVAGGLRPYGKHPFGPQVSSLLHLSSGPASLP